MITLPNLGVYFNGTENSFAIFHGELIGVPAGISEWYTCRDRILSSFNRYNPRYNPSEYAHLLYCCKQDETMVKVCNFIRAIQKAMKLDKVNKVKIHKTNHPKITCFELPLFWRRSLKFSFLTLLVRAGRTYEGRQWKKTLDSCKYCKAERPRIAAHYFIKSGGVFLYDGPKIGQVTACNNLGHGHGWCAFFSQLKKSDIIKVFQKETK